MKRTVFILIICLFTANIVEAQRREVRRANRSLNRGELNQAKTHIDNAIQDESTMDDPETWILRSDVYLQIAATEEEEFQDLHENPLLVAEESLQKAYELDFNPLQEVKIQQTLLVLSEYVYNEGVVEYQRENFGESSDLFLRAYEMLEPHGTMDTTTLYNAALSAELGENYEKAVPLYKRLIDMDYEQPFLYTSMGNILMAQGDTLDALDYVLQGRNKYPDDLNIIFSEANIHIFSGDSEKAREVLALAIEKDPENHSLYFALAANFDRMAQDTTYAEADRQVFFKEAEKYYKQSIDMKDDYFDGIFNLGVLYFNEGIRIYTLADSKLRETQDFTQYEKDAEVFQEAWLKSQPYFERAKSMLPPDDPYYQTVIVSLIQLYARTNQPENLQEVQNIYQEHFDSSDDE